MGTVTGTGRNRAETRAARATWRAGRVQGGLHIAHHFTDAWATDGSRNVFKDDTGRVYTRVACGMTEGILMTERGWGETEEEALKRGIGEGIRGKRLPESYEVVDAELTAILHALTTTASRDNPRRRRCLVCSDCLSALRMVEDAWRMGVTWTGARSGRAAILHAINEVREKIELCVMMWNPAHSGVANNAVADAAAGAYLNADPTDTMEELRRHLPGGRYIQATWEKGSWKEWPKTRFAAIREATGWWVRGQETSGRSRVVEVPRIGKPWDERSPDRWEDVWVKTGARAPRQPKEEEEEREERNAGRTLLEIAEEAVSDAAAHRKKGRTRDPTAKEMSDDRGRCGVAMTARARGIRERTWGPHPQGCAACCSRARGWGWQEEGGKRVWGRGNERSTQADEVHKQCGECEGIEKEEREAVKGVIKEGLREALRAALTQPKKSGPVITGGRQRLVARIAAAQRALARGSDAKPADREALGAWIAGDLPNVKGEDEGMMRGITRRTAEAVKKSQRAAATYSEAWKKGGEAERARRTEREGGAEGRRWKGIGWQAWSQGHRAIKEGEKAEENGEGERVKGGQRQGWTMAAALIWYQQQKLERVRRKEARREEEGEEQETREDTRGRNVVVFDVETTHLIEKRARRPSRTWTYQ